MGVEAPPPITLPTACLYKANSGWKIASSTLGVFPSPDGYAFAVGDTLLSVIVGGNDSGVTVTPPAGWDLLAAQSAAGGNVRMAIAVNTAWAAGDGRYWGLTGFTTGTYSDVTCQTWWLKGTGGTATVAPPAVSYHPGSRASYDGYPVPWVAPPGGTLRFQFIAAAGNWGEQQSPWISPQARMDRSHYQVTESYPCVANLTTTLGLLQTAPPLVGDFWLYEYDEVTDPTNSTLSPYSRHTWAIGVGIS
jgi:hypothetical protein